MGGCREGSLIIVGVHDGIGIPWVETRVGDAPFSDVSSDAYTLPVSSSLPSSSVL